MGLDFISGQHFALDIEFVDCAVVCIEIELAGLDIGRGFADIEITRRQVDGSFAVCRSDLLTVLVEDDRAGSGVNGSAEVYPFLLGEESRRRERFLLSVDIARETVLALRIKEECETSLIGVVETGNDCAFLVIRYIHHHHGIRLADRPEGDGELVIGDL